MTPRAAEGPNYVRSRARATHERRHRVTIPYTPVRPLFGHLLYGVITGTAFHALVDY